MSEKVTIGVALEGVEKATRDAESFGDALAQMYSGLNVTSMSSTLSGTAKPAGAPSIVPGTTNGLGQFNQPINTSQSQLDMGLGTLHGVLASPYTSFVTQTNPNIVPKAPDPYASAYAGGYAGGYGSIPPPMLPSSGSGGGPLDVRIVGSVALHFANLASGGIMGGGSGTGGGFGGGLGLPSGAGGGGQGSGGMPVNPFAGGFNPHGAGGGLQGFLSAVQQNPTLSGIMSAGVSTLSKASPAFAAALGPIGLAAGIAKAVVGTGVEAADMYYASQAPAYQMNTDFMARGISGGFVSDIERRDAAKIASAQGALGAYQSLNHSSVGRSLNFIGGDIPDLLMSRNITPRFEREIALKQARMSSDRQIQNLTNLVGSPVGALSGTDLTVSTAMAGSALRFGSGGLRGLAETDFSDLAARGYLPDQMNAMIGTIHGIASSQQNGALYGQLAGGANQRGLAAAVLPGLIARADIDGINSLRPQIGAGAANAAVAQARQTFALGVTSQIDQSLFSSAGSQVSLLGATGAGYRQIAGAVGTQANSLNAVKGDLQRQMGLAAAAGNTADVASLGAQINQLNAQQASLHQQQALGIFSGRATETNALSIGASNSMFSALYNGGGQGGVDAAYGLQGKAGLAEAQRLEDMSRSPFISPEQRELYRQQAVQQRQQSTTGIDRQRSQFDYSIRQGQLGVAGARADLASTRSQLFGDQEGIYASAMARTGVTAGSLAAVNARLSDPTAHLDPAERLDLMQRGIELQRQVNQGLEENKRSLLGMRVATDQAQSSITRMGVGQQLQFFGAGGAAAGALQSGDIGASRRTLRDAQGRFDYFDGLVKSGKMSAANSDYLAAKTGLIGAQGDLYGSEAALSTLPGSLASRNQLLDSQFAMKLAQSSFLPFGNVRGNIEGGMGAIGSQLRDLDANERRAIREANQDTYKDDAAKQARLGQIRYDFKARRYRLNENLASMQADLQVGWMDRLISSQVGMPSRAGFVASAFTQHEAAGFLQNTDLYNGAFGFSSASGRDDIMFRHPRLYSNTIGAISRPEGFLSTAMSGASPSQMTGVLKAPPTEVRVILEDHRTTVIANGKSTTVNHPGGNAAHIQALGNGSLEMTRSSHAASSSHQ